MAYTPPEGDNVILNFTGAYTPPEGDELILNFTEEVYVPRYGFVVFQDPGII